MPVSVLVEFNEATTPLLSKSGRSAFGPYTPADLEIDKRVIHVRRLQFKGDYAVLDWFGRIGADFRVCGQIPSGGFLDLASRLRWRALA
jgi:hypothetical protein